MTHDELEVLKVKAALLNKGWIYLEYRTPKGTTYTTTFPVSSAREADWEDAFPEYKLVKIELRTTIHS